MIKRMIKRNILIGFVAVFVAALVALPGALQAERIKDIVQIKGVRSNPLQGYGLVIGLDGTGDNSPVTQQALTNILRREGLTLNPAQMAGNNIASVMITAELLPFARKGSSIDVNVAAIAGSASLQGGTLLITYLKGADGEVYAVAQGELAIGGFSAGGAGATVKKNHTSAGSIPSGAIVEREELANYVENGEITLQLRNPDFSTAEAMVQVINKVYPKAAHAPDGGTVRIKLPANLPKKRISGFVNQIGLLDVKVDTPAIVVINERTGTIVIGASVKISTTAISHGNLSIITRVDERVVQPTPFSNTGTTAIQRNENTNVIEGSGTLHVVPEQTTVSQLARALNAMGLTPRDLISIFKALQKAGALQAKLKIM